MLQRIIIALMATAALGSVLGTGVAAASGHRHHRGHHMGYAGPPPSRSWTGIWAERDTVPPTAQQTYSTWPEGSPDYHGANGM